MKGITWRVSRAEFTSIAGFFRRWTRRTRQIFFPSNEQLDRRLTVTTYDAHGRAADGFRPPSVYPSKSNGRSKRRSPGTSLRSAGPAKRRTRRVRRERFETRATVSDNRKNLRAPVRLSKTKSRRRRFFVFYRTRSPASPTSTDSQRPSVGPGVLAPMCRGTGCLLRG